ncbi:MAG TPA: methionyl-tRNA formyltransferase [Gammaproteobacteria bacterium]|nr:methionyl-tRNA formyltransferase [Gammaproteobacteria bacterium]
MPAAKRVVFAGTPAFAVPALDALLASHYSVAAVYTQPDRPAGRGRRLQPSPVKLRALEAGVPVRQPPTLKDAAEQAALEALAPDAMIVVAYGLILPATILRAPAFGCVNIHASLLPRWRGAAPIQRAILAGDAETGISIMQMDAGLDTGPVLARRATPIAADETSATLHDRLATLGAETIVPALDALIGGTAVSEPQPAAGATYAAKLEKSEARLDWSAPAEQLARQVRALQPWPVAEARLDGAQLRVWAAEPLPGAAHATPGSIVDTGRDGIEVATGDGLLRIRTVQRAGGKRIDAAAFARGTSLVGKVLE